MPSQPVEIYNPPNLAKGKEKDEFEDMAPQIKPAKRIGIQKVIDDEKPETTASDRFKFDSTDVIEAEDLSFSYDD